jgi:1,2-diacylglycerol 3-alpha-glucosyltransferase
VPLLAPSYGSGDEAGQQVVRIPSRRLPVDPEDRMMKRRKLLQLSKQIGNETYHIVHIQTPFVAHYAGVKLARRLGLPVVESYHTFFEEYLKNI